MSRAYNAKRTDAVIPAIIQAVGLAGISNVFHSPDLMVRAYQDYGKALTMTNKALRDPVKAIEDMTLMAVWFLGIFEVSLLLNVA